LLVIDSAIPLTALGWNPFFEEALATLKSKITLPPDLVVARVVVQQRERWLTAGPAGELNADLRGKFRREAALFDVPGVGDFVLMSARPDEGRATIQAVVPRRTVLARKVAGRTTEGQVIAANIDTVFVTVPLITAINPRLIERQLAAVWESGATPVVLGTKADRAPDVDITELHAAAVGADVVLISARTGEGLDQLAPWLAPQKTLALLGPSGAGKSTLTNALLDEHRMVTQDIREGDGKGRHTTSHRELVMLPSGAMLIDTPGLRELAMWNDTDEGLGTVFDDMIEIAEECHFTDCSHGNEPGCAVRLALESGTLDHERFDSWQKLQKEMAFVARQQDVRLAAEEKRKWMVLSKAARANKKKS
jgi:ribosome biogenesis GTPase / thiamine phosphate phosphatase